MSSHPKIAMLVMAAGVGARADGGLAGGDGTPKQYRPLAGVPVLTRTVNAALAHPSITRVICIIHPDHAGHYAALGLSHTCLEAPVYGGGTRQDSVLRGLEALAGDPPDLVLVQDAARPFLSPKLIDGVLAALARAAGALPVVSVTDTLKRSMGGELVEATEDRGGLYGAQTPQGFHFGTILEAHRRAADSENVFTDDASIAEWAGLDVALSAGDPDNIKLTSAADFARAERIVGGRPMETRVGSGVDVHAFEPGDGLILGGVHIPHSARLRGHSDADMALHVLTDALLGALADGDIGVHFPPSDSKWKGEPSRTFLRFARERVAARGGRIVHLDLTIMCEEPKIGPHVAAMRHSIAEIADIDVSRVSIKATTAEHMGFVGRGEGMMTMGTATIELPAGG